MFVRKPTLFFCAFLSLHFSISIAQVSPPNPYSGSAPVNYVRVWEGVKPTTDANTFTTAAPLQTAKMTTSYFDGLGRKIQQVVKQGSLTTGGTVNDLVAAIVYDEFGRELYNYLPFAANNTGGNSSITDGLFKLNPFQQQETFATAQFPGETFFYGKTNYEPSPLNRIISIYSPGNSWSGSEGVPGANDRHGIQIGYNSNTATDSVRIWNVSEAGISSTPSAYPEGELYKTVTEDENKNKIVEYKDKEGKVILKKVQIADSPAEGHTGWLCTYYVYDILNNLRLVTPPKATKELAASGWSLTPTILDELCYRYEFDERNRPIIKKVPGAAEVRMVYDARDRMVLAQDGNQRNGHLWLYMQYDPLNRPVATGTIEDPANYNNHGWHRDQAAASTTYPDLGGYTHNELTGTFYDNYDWRANHGNPLSGDLNTTNNEYLLAADNNTYPYPQAVTKSNQVVGQVTGARAKLLGTGTWLYTVNFYDDKGRLIQAQTQNSTLGTDIVTTQYGWTGLPIRIIQRMQKAGTNAQTILVLTQLTYDDLGRISRTDKRISNSLINGGAMPGTWTTVSENEYDALGQLKKKKLGTSLETMEYDYNIRGWLLGINREFVNDDGDHAFGFELGYDKTGTIIPGSSFAAAQYDGNIGGMLWKSKGDGQKRKYDFNYDATGRLLKADFNQYTGGVFSKSAGIDFSVVMGDGVHADSAFDENGNILRMRQWGLKGFSSSLVDDLQYTYTASSNKLKNVLDAHNEPLTTLGDFRSSQAYMTILGGTKTISATDYAYDMNGNMNKDLNKDIDDDAEEGIEYNYLNLPSRIRVKGKGSIEYLYDATGNKWQKTVKETGKPDKVTLYLGGCIFENDTLQLIFHDEGRARPSGDSMFVYDYFIKDHLGNVRAVLTEQNQPAAGYYAGMETADLAIEEQLFTQIPETVADKPGGFDTDVNNQKVSKLFNTSGSDKRVGPGLLLKVMAGDKFRAGVKAWYQPGTTVSELPGATSIVNSLISAFTGGWSGAGGHGAGGAAPGITELTNPFDFFVTNNNNSTSPTIPKAYLNWVVLDEQQFNLVSGNYGASQVPEITGLMEKQVVTANGGADIEIKNNGYLYVYVSNESQGAVYFDELSVTHTRGTLLEESHYYPFGLQMAGISSKALLFGDPGNKKKYQQYELNTDFDLNLYESFYRSHDPQLGRFWQPDTKPTHMLSLYSAMGNNPIKYSDPLGDTLFIQYKGKQVMYNNGVLSNRDGSEYKGKVKGFLNKAVKALNKINGTKDGSDVVSTLQSSENNFTIDNSRNNPHGNKSEFIEDNKNINKSYAVAGIENNPQAPGWELGGVGGTIYWDPSGTSVPVAGGGTNANAISDLAHEMFHGYESNAGMLDNSNISGLSRMEWRAVYFENQIRASLGAPLRSHYSSILDLNTGIQTGTGPSMLNANGQPVYQPPTTIPRRFYYYDVDLIKLYGLKLIY